MKRIRFIEYKNYNDLAIIECEKGSKRNHLVLSREFLQENKLIDFEGLNKLFEF